MSTTRWPELSAAIAAPALLMLAACAGPDPGPRVTKQIEVGSFQGVELRGSAELQIEVGPAVSLRADGPQNFVDAIKTSVEGDKLVIEDTNHWWGHGKRGGMHLRLAAPVLSSLSTSGATQAGISGLNGGDLSLQIQGAGQVEATGNVVNLSATMNGAGRLALSGLVARNAVATLNGAGSVELNVTGSLQATVNGVGSIEYSGNPTDVKTAMNGVGSIKAK